MWLDSTHPEEAERLRSKDEDLNGSTSDECEHEISVCNQDQVGGNKSTARKGGESSAKRGESTLSTT